MYTLNIFEVINTEYAVAPEDGIIVFDILNKQIKSKNKVELDFSGLERVITAFLNPAIGSLYKEFDSQTLNTYLVLKNVKPQTLELLKQVIEIAQLQFKDSDLREFL